MKALSILIFLLLGFSDLATAQWKPVATLPAEAFLDFYSTGNVLYAASTHRIYHSKDGGLSWSASSLINTEDDEVSDLLVIDSVIYAAMLLNGCYISTDHGKSWKQHNAGLNGLGAHNLSSFAVRDNKIYLGTLGSGVFVKPLGEPFAPWQTFNHEIPWLGIQSLYVDGDQLLAGAGGGASLARNAAGKSNWTEHSFDKVNGEMNIFLTAMREGAVLHGAGSQGLYRSMDGGATWTSYYPGIGFIERARFANWQGAAVVLLRKPNGSSYLGASKNQGQSWSAFQHTFPKRNAGFDLHVHDGKLFYAASDGVWVLSTTVPTRNPLVTDFELGQNYPNPSNDTYTIIPFRLEYGGNGHLSLFDILGRVVHQRDLGKLGAGKHESRIDISRLSKGIYVYALEVDGKVLSKMMVVE